LAHSCPFKHSFIAQRRIAADLDEQRTKVFVIDIEVVVIDVNRFVPLEFKPPLVVLLPAKRVRFLLRDSNEHDAVPCASLPPEIVANLILVLVALELMHRNLFLCRESLYGPSELLRNLAQNHWRRDWLLQLLPHENAQLRPRRQLANVAIQIQPVQALDL
jgi:hypothetical protein